MSNEKSQKVRLAFPILFLVMISFSVGGIVGNGNLAMSLWFAGVWLLVAPTLIKQIYDIKIAEEASGQSNA